MQRRVQTSASCRSRLSVNRIRFQGRTTRSPDRALVERVNVLVVAYSMRTVNIELSEVAE